MRRKLMAATMLAMTLALGGCGTTGESPVSITVTENDNGEEASGTEASEETAEEEPDSEETTAETENSNKDGSPKKMFASRATIEETVMVDQDDVKIIANSIEYDDYRATLNLTIENNSQQNLSFHCGTLGFSMNTINGCVVSDGYLNSEVSAGMKAKEKVYFDADELMSLGIYDISEIGMAIYVNNEDSDTILQTDLVTVPTSIYDQCDFAEDTIKKAIDDGVWENDLSMDLTYVNTDFACAQEGLNISAVVMAKNESGDSVICLDVENTSDEQLALSTKHVEINGVTVLSSTWNTFYMPPHKRILETFRLDTLIDEEFRSIVNQDEIGTFKFDLEKIDIDTYDTISSSEVSIVFDEKIGEVSVGGTPIYEANGITVYPMPVTIDDYGMDYYVPLFVINESGKTITAEVDERTFAMGGYMVDCLNFSKNIKDGASTVLKIEISVDKAKEVEINDVSDFKNATCKLEIRDSEKYSMIDNPSVEIQFQ